MIEILGLVFTFLAALWARKQDIAAYLQEEESRSRVVSAVLVPEKRFRRVSQELTLFLDRALEHGTRFFFAIFMLSLLYVSASFVLSLAISDSKALLFGYEYEVVNAQIAFLIFLISAPFVLMAGSTHNRQISPRLVNESNHFSAERKAIKLRQRSRAAPYFALCSFIFSASVYLVYESKVLAGYALLSSASLSVKPEFLKPFFLLRRSFWSASAGANLGALGLLLATYSFASESMGFEDYIFIVSLSILSGVLSALSLLTCQTESDPTYRDFWRFRAKPGFVSATLSALGRPSLFVGFHCARSAGPFGLAVAIILLNVAIARTLVPPPIVNAGTVMLACIVFFSGATTLAGAGVFSFGAVVLVGVYMSLDPSKLFSLWAAPFLLWILIPIVNSFIDMARWQFARKNLSSYALGKGASGARLVYFDALLGVFGFFLYVFVSFFVLSAFEATGRTLGYEVSFQVTQLVAALKSDLIGNGVWLVFIAGTMMLPTALQFALFLYSGLVFLVPKRHLRDVALKVSGVQSTYDRDVLAWQIAALDVMSRLVFSGVVLVAVGALISSVLPLGGWLTIKALELGSIYGAHAVNWLLAAS